MKLRANYSKRDSRLQQFMETRTKPLEWRHYKNSNQELITSLWHDVAARGLDIKSIKSVVNFDIARDMDMHVHRNGRTGRAGDKDGIAYTLTTQKEACFAGEPVNSLIAAGQDVTHELMDIAMKDSRFRSKRDARKGSGGKKGGGKGKGGGGVGEVFVVLTSDLVLVI